MAGTGEIILQIETEPLLGGASNGDDDMGRTAVSDLS
jgi:hypothetical protein